MNKQYFLILLVFGFCLNAFGQNATNSSININGKVYYYKPSTTSSSPQPRVSGSRFINHGRWYGVEAAKAWAALEDWAMEQCEHDDPEPESNETWMEYIMSVEAKREPWDLLGLGVKKGNNRIVIQYWMVRRADGQGYRSTARTIYFK
ncbi:MAG: hypothetical protein LBK00_09510 [Treponema sp.]|jgi:hypothetical protein|nr:hypothetical protein [Treponema sp.]